MPAAAGGGAVRARVSRSGPEASLRAAALARVAGARSRMAGVRSRMELRLGTADIAPDLAQDIGSRRWFRGFGTMLGLGMVALSFWPDMTAVEAATAMPVDSAVRDEFRSQMIMPLALGAESGRHMGATAAVQPLRAAPERPSLDFASTLASGDSLSRMLQRAGVGAADASRVMALVGNAVPSGRIAPGTRFDISLGRRPSPGAPRPLERMDFRARFDLDVTIARNDDALSLERRPIAVDATPLRIRGPVGGSLYRSARAAGAPLKAIQQYLQAIDDRVSLEGGIAPGDRYDLIVAYRRAASGERQVGELLYAGLESGGKPRLSLMRWGSDGQFFEASGVGRRESAHFAPVTGRITSSFGLRRHPILGYRRMHSGIDYAAHYGTPIRAVSDGVVTFAGRHGGHGNFVRLSHGGGLGTGYAHMSRIAVSPGTDVRAGQVIGYVGSTGLSTGPHLHFEVYQGGRKLDPMAVRFVSRPQIDGEELARFRQRLARLKAIAPGAALRDLAPTATAASEPAREIDRLAMADTAPTAQLLRN